MKKRSVYSATTVALLVAARVISVVPAEAAPSAANPGPGKVSGETGSSAEALQRFLRESPGSDLVGPAFSVLVAQSTTAACQDPGLRGSLTSDEFNRLCGCDDPELRLLLDPEEYGRLCEAGTVGAFEVAAPDDVC